MTNLAESIRLAHSQNEARIAAEIATPKSELDTVAQAHIQHFAEFCRSRGLPGLPARPSTCAMFVRSEDANGVLPEYILAALSAIEALHSDNNLANPVATKAVRLELQRIKVDRPRSWAPEHQDLWASLPIEAKHVIRNYADLATKAVRKAQNETAELRHKLKSFEQKGIDSNGSSDQKAD